MPILVSIVVSSKILNSHLKGLKPKNVVETYTHRNIPLPSAPSHVNVNSDQQLLSVTFCINERPLLRIYEIETLLNEVRVDITEIFKAPLIC